MSSDYVSAPGSTVRGDALLLDRLRAGDESAFAEAFEAHAPRLYRLALGLLRDPDLANDAVQRAFITLFEKIDGFEGRSALGTWLYRVAYNEALMMIRAAKPTESLEPPEGERLPVPQQLVDWTRSPERIAVGIDLNDALERAVGDLPEALRAAFLLRDVEGLSTAEAASALDISSSALKVRLHRARLILREQLSANYRGEQAVAADVGAVTCQDVVTYLSDYLDRDLDGELQADVEEHVAGCGACRVALDTTRHTIALYQERGRHVVLPERERLYVELRAIFARRS